MRSKLEFEIYLSRGSYIWSATDLDERLRPRHILDYCLSQNYSRNKRQLNRQILQVFERVILSKAQCRSFFFGLAICATTLFAVGAAQATERFDFYDGIRELSMGGAAVATVNDETALLLNPAALGRLRNYFVTVLDPEIDIGAKTQSMIGSDVTKFLDPQKVLDACNASKGEHLHERAQLFPSFVVTNFGFGFYARYATDAFVDAYNGNPFTYQYRNDYAGVLGFNLRLFDGRVKIGANARGVNRVESNRTDIPSTSTGLTKTTVVNNVTVVSEGFGVGSDAGLILSAPWTAIPTLAVVYRDIGTTSYTINHGSEYSTTFRPARTPGTLDAGFSLNPILSNNVRMVFTAEMRDVMDAVEPKTVDASDQVMRRLHGGVELNIYDVFYIRAGYNQGYWTAGIELSMLNTQLQFSSYGEEIGDVVAPGSGNTYKAKEDRRYAAKFAYRF